MARRKAVSYTHLQAKILANQIVSNDYLNNAERESAINVQLEQLSTIYDGRVMIIDEEFHRCV